MSILNNRGSVLALVEEVTEGVPLAPSAGTDAVALQDGFSLDPAFNSLANAEIKPSIGQAKPITGLETPISNLNHYVRHSGVEGVAPKFAILLKSLFGSQTTNSTERLTGNSSTSSVIKVASGITDFKRGFAALFKLSAGFVIRPIDSVDVPGTAFTLGFNLAGAPASGVKLGKCINFSPVNAGHPTFTQWLYRANGGAIEMIAGARTADMQVDVQAGALINSIFKMSGIKYHFDPITIASTDTKLDFLDNSTTLAASVAAGTYRDPIELAQAIQDAMNSLGSANTFSCTYDSALGKFTITSSGTTLSLLWSSGTNTGNTIGDKLGFDVSADDTGALTYTSDNAQSWAFPFTPSYDSADPNVAKANEVLLGDATDTATFTASSFTIKASNQLENVEDVSAPSGIQGKYASKRAVSIDIKGVLKQNDVSKFKKFRANENAKFCFNYGVKAGGNWVPGLCGSYYLPTSVLSKFLISDKNALVTLELTATAYVDSNGNGEFYHNLL